VTATAKKILKEVLALPARDRRCIAEAILNSVPPETPGEIESAWLEEGQKRAGRLERGEVEARDGDQVMAELEAKLQVRLVQPEALAWGADQSPTTEAASYVRTRSR
jgi:hypothetical protein